jgi:threonine synthase
VAQGLIGAHETVALLITGNGLKDIQSAIKAAGAPTYIEPDLAAVKAALGSS